MAAGSCTFVRRLPWCCAQAGPLGTPHFSLVLERATTGPSRLAHALVGCGLFPAIHTCKVGNGRQKSERFPLELQLLLTAPSLPAALPPPASIPSWVGDNSQQGPLASALLSRPCQTLIADCTAAATAHECGTTAAGNAHLELANAKFRSTIDIAANANLLRRKKPWTGHQLLTLPLAEPQVLHASVTVARGQASLAQQPLCPLVGAALPHSPSPQSQQLCSA